MRDRSMQSEPELGREIKLTGWSMAGNLSKRSSGVQIPRDIYTRLKRYLHSAKCSWIISSNICPWTLSVPRSSQFTLSENCSLLGTDGRKFMKPRRQRQRERHQTKGLMS